MLTLFVEINQRVMQLSVVGFKTGEKFEKDVKISFSIFYLSHSIDECIHN